MKRTMSYILMALLSASVALRAEAMDDTNNIAVAILSYAAQDNEDDLEFDVEYPVRYTDWNGLLDGVSLSGVTRHV